MSFDKLISFSHAGVQPPSSFMQELGMLSSFSGKQSIDLTLVNQAASPAVNPAPWVSFAAALDYVSSQSLPNVLHNKVSIVSLMLNSQTLNEKQREIGITTVQSRGNFGEIPNNNPSDLNVFNGHASNSLPPLAFLSHHEAILSQDAFIGSNNYEKTNSVENELHLTTTGIQPRWSVTIPPGGTQSFFGPEGSGEIKDTPFRAKQIPSGVDMSISENRGVKVGRIDGVDWVISPDKYEFETCRDEWGSSFAPVTMSQLVAFSDNVTREIFGRAATDAELQKIYQLNHYGNLGTNLFHEQVKDMLRSQ